MSMRYKNQKGGWDKNSTWYNGMVGTNGSRVHQDYLFPLLKKDIKNSKMFLDIGCGNGFLTNFLDKEVKNYEYLGIDSSKNLIDIARSNFRSKFKTFKVFNIVKDNTKSINNFFDTGLMILSLQDINEWDKAFTNIAKLIDKNGQLIIFMLHPCFRVPRQSGWGFDEKRKLTYRRVDSYLSYNAVPYKVVNNRVSSYFYHNPLNVIINTLAKQKCFLTNMEEIAENAMPKDLKHSKRAKEEIPMFLYLQFIKN